MDHVLAAFRERREPFAGRDEDRPTEDDEEDNDRTAGDDAPAVDPAEEQSLKNFELLFELLLNAENEAKHAITAYELTRYVCERLRPEPDRIRMAWGLGRRDVEGGLPA